MGVNRIGNRALFLAAGVVGVMATASAHADVQLRFAPNTGTPALIHMAPNRTFRVPVYVHNNEGEKLTSASVNFDITGPAGGDHFTYQSRLLNWTDSDGSHTSVFPDVAVTTPPSGGTLPTTESMPKNQNFLATTAANPADNDLPFELNNGIHPFAQFTFNVLATAPNGVYTLTTYDDDTFSWNAGKPGYTDFPYDAVATVTVVVPEPGAVGLVAAAAVAGLAGRRRMRRA
ncbi:MAG TPA: PEP-CTERM sorting domain-containing protein [Tepidisphaeraceae bacterium]|nr:PEP-CTERM sorting domain-containing protein [Tepidisphaeraceae bacterium]